MPDAQARAGVGAADWAIRVSRLLPVQFSEGQEPCWLRQMGAKSSVMRSLLPSLRRAVGVAGLAAILPIPVSAEPVLAAVRDIERDLDARVGFYMHDTHSGQTLAYAADDRFPLNSTFKLLACGALLGRAESGEVSLSQKVRLQDIEIVAYSPEIVRRVQAGHEDVSLGAACEMTLAVSDNSAANIVLSAIGGPDGLTGYLRSIGDQVTRLDRWETELNAAVPGDPRDSTSPRETTRQQPDVWPATPAGSP